MANLTSSIRYEMVRTWCTCTCLGVASWPWAHFIHSCTCRWFSRPVRPASFARNSGDPFRRPVAWSRPARRAPSLPDACATLLARLCASRQLRTTHTHTLHCPGLVLPSCVPESLKKPSVLLSYVLGSYVSLLLPDSSFVFLVSFFLEYLYFMWRASDAVDPNPSERAC